MGGAENPLGVAGLGHVVQRLSDEQRRFRGLVFRVRVGPLYFRFLFQLCQARDQALMRPVPISHILDFTMKAIEDARVERVGTDGIRRGIGGLEDATGCIDISLTQNQKGLLLQELRDSISGELHQELFKGVRRMGDQRSQLTNEGRPLPKPLPRGR